MASLFASKPPAEALAEDAARATAVLERLTVTTGELKSMPKSELATCNGLCVTFLRKIGAGVTLEKGHGFVIRKLPAGALPDGRAGWKWSAPLVMHVESAGLGLSLGFSEMEAITILDTAEAVSAFEKSQWTVDVEMSGAAGPEGVSLPATAANLTDLKLSDKTFCYSTAKGAMLDMSWAGTRHGVDAKANKALFGEAAAPHDILGGSVEAPACMQPLYAALDKAINDWYAEAAAGAAAAAAHS